MRRLALLAGTALALAGCSTFPELDAQITDQARGADYLSLKPLDTVTTAPDPVLEDSAATGAALETAGLALQARGTTVAALDPGLIDTARSKQEHAERLIAESALARLQLQDSAVAGTSAETRAQTAPEADATALATAPDPAPDTPDTDPAALQARIDALLARTDTLKDESLDARRLLLLQRAKELGGI